MSSCFFLLVSLLFIIVTPAEYFCLEDCTHPFKKPCIMDLKIGRKVCEQGSNENKILRSIEKYPVQEAIGFRIVGMRVSLPCYCVVVIVVVVIVVIVVYSRCTSA